VSLVYGTARTGWRAVSKNARTALSNASAVIPSYASLTPLVSQVGESTGRAAARAASRRRLS
jgi:hypothetical protein